MNGKRIALYAFVVVALLLVVAGIVYLSNPYQGYVPFTSNAYNVSFMYPQSWSVTSQVYQTGTPAKSIVLFPTSSGRYVQMHITSLPAAAPEAKTFSFLLYNTTLNAVLADSGNLTANKNITLSGYAAREFAGTAGGGSAFLYILANATTNYFIIQYIAANASAYSRFLPQAQNIIGSIRLNGQ
ncbi:MAG: hypothetical protein KGH98_02960 [Candidatus Micrarchaeota archaeon]|nr:hypothetical protein [Candidatus Micrarchaeota archaeon]